MMSHISQGTHIHESIEIGDPLPEEAIGASMLPY